MRVLLALALVGAMGLSGLPAEEPQAFYVLGAEDGAGPWGGPDGEGCGNDIVKAAFSAAGSVARLSVLPYARAKKMTLEGSLDGCFGMAKIPELEGEILFSERPLYRVTPTFFANTARAARTRSLVDVRPGSIVGIVVQYEYPDAVMDIPLRGGELQKVPTETLLLKMLAEGRLDFVVLMLDPLKNASVLERESETEGLVRAAFALPDIGTYVGFSLRSPKGPAAKAIFDEGFARLLASGEYAAILGRWRR